MASPSALIFGAGQNIGAALIKGFVTAGYRVAAVSRSSASAPASESPDNFIAIQADLSDSSNIPDVFAKLPSNWPFPSVVIWNAFAHSEPESTDPENPFAVPEEDFDRDLRLMIKSPYFAAREAVKAWMAEGYEAAANGRKGTFIMTGNMQAVQIFAMPALTTLGIGKAGANYWVGSADAVLKERGIRFFFGDERNVEGLPIGTKPNGDGHARMYLHMVEGGDELPHYVSFLNGEYHKF